jgi:hypothetical protein
MRGAAEAEFPVESVDDVRFKTHHFLPSVKCVMEDLML